MMPPYKLHMQKSIDKKETDIKQDQKYQHERPDENHRMI